MERENRLGARVDCLDDVLGSSGHASESREDGGNE